MEGRRVAVATKSEKLKDNGRDGAGICFFLCLRGLRVCLMFSL
jgi:hypothetical protein